MDFYYKKVNNFVNIFSNNLYNEYNKKPILIDKLQNYRKMYDNNLLKKILSSADKIILDKIDLAYKNNIKRKYKQILNTSKIEKICFVTNKEINGDLTKYSPSIFKSTMNLYYRFLNWFSAKDKFYVKENLIKNLNNTENYTEEGLADYKIIPDIQNLIEVRNIENTGGLDFSFEMTLFNPSLFVVTNKLCNLKVYKENDALKINELNCEDL